MTVAFTKRELGEAGARAAWREGDGGGRREATDDVARDCSLKGMRPVRLWVWGLF
jgi:hypothetical protein